jgi:hypothetical protein
MEDKILFLKEAVKAFQLVKRTADAALEHHFACPVCSSKVVRYFWRCRTREALAFDYLTAKVQSDEFILELRNLILELQSTQPDSPDDPKLLQWLEGLHKLKDDRSE